MTPLAAGLVMGGLSVTQSLFGNAAISEAALSQYKSNKLFIERDQEVLNTQLKYAGVDVNNELGMALSDILYQAAQAQAQTTATQAETNVYGNTARRQQLAVEMQRELANDSVTQKAEAKMVDVQQKLTEVKYQTEAKHIQNIQAYNQMMSQVQSPFEILATAVGAGFSAYGTQQAIGAAELTKLTQAKQLETLKAGVEATNYSTFALDKTFPLIFLPNNNVYGK